MRPEKDTFEKTGKYICYETITTLTVFAVYRHCGGTDNKHS
jgi:hypothetical protein